MEKSSISQKVLLIIISLCFVLFTGCQSWDNKIQKTKIGAILPLTGSLGFIGEYEKNAMTLGLEQYMGPKHVSFVFEDCGANTKLAVNAANKLVNVDRVSMAFSSPSFISWSVLNILKDKGIPHFVLSFDPALPEEGCLVYRFFESSIIEAHGFIKFISEKGAKKVVFLRHMHPDAEKAFRQIVRPALNERGIMVVDIPYQLDTKDFTNYVEKAKAEDADLIVIQAFGHLVPLIVKKIKELGLEKPILGDLNFLEIEDAYLDLVENIPFISLDYVFTEPYRKFVADYQARFGKKPLAPAAFCYDLVGIVNSFLDQNNDSFDSKRFSEFYLSGQFQTKIVKNFKVEPDGDLALKPVFARYIAGEIKK